MLIDLNRSNSVWINRAKHQRSTWRLRRWRSWSRTFCTPCSRASLTPSATTPTTRYIHMYIDTASLCFAAHASRVFFSLLSASTLCIIAALFKLYLSNFILKRFCNAVNNTLWLQLPPSLTHLLMYDVGGGVDFNVDAPHAYFSFALDVFALAYRSCCSLYHTIDANVLSCLGSFEARRKPRRRALHPLHLHATVKLN